MDTIRALQGHLSSDRILSQRMLNELHPKAIAGDKEAMSKIVDSLLAWTIRMAMRIYDRCGKGRSTIDPDEVVQEALVGLIEGINRFDPKRGYYMTTYCSYHIRKRCLGFCYDSKLIRIPRYLLAKRTPEAKRQGPAFKEVISCIENHEELFSPVLSYEMPKMCETLEDYAEAYKELDVLKYRTKIMLIERYFEGRTLAVIGKKWGVCKERVRQIIKEALTILEERRS